MKEEKKIASREEIKKIKGMTPKVYEQSIGFLRIPDGTNPLDKTGIHPESYEITNNLLNKLSLKIEQMNTEKFKETLSQLDISKLATELNTDNYTLEDIIKELLNPGLDPRDELEAPILKSDILHIEDLKIGMELQGTVRNVASFGAFVDIGLHDDGLIHISKMSKSFVKNPNDIVHVGDIITCYVDNVDLEKQKGHNLQDVSVFKRFLVMFMGVGFNFIFAILVLFFTGLIYGSPNLDPVISDVTAGYPAQVAGLSKGDKVIKINDHKITYLDDISLYLTVEDLNNEITFEVKKQNGTEATYKIKPQKETVDNEDTYKIGIVLKSEAEKGIGNAFVYAFKGAGAIFKQMFVVLGNLFTGGVSVNQLSGPVGIYSIVGQMEEQGLNALLYLVALLSINVGIINLLPLPAFDGGRILFLIIEKIKGKPVSPKVENAIHSVGFILLMLLMVYITFNDILKLF